MQNQRRWYRPACAESDTALPFSVFLACLVTIQSFVLCCSSSPHGSPHQPDPPPPFFIPSPPLHSSHASSLSSLSPTHAWFSTTERLKIAPGIPASVQIESWGGCGERQLLQGHKTPPPPPHPPLRDFFSSPFITAPICVFQTWPKPCQVLSHHSWMDTITSIPPTP